MMAGDSDGEKMKMKRENTGGEMEASSIYM